MKKQYIALTALVLAAGTCGAEIIRPDVSFDQDFSTLGDNGDPLPQSWVTYGKGFRPLDAWQDVFGTDGTGPSYRLLNIADTWGAFSNSSFVEDIAADEWLVTPPIHISSDEEILVLTAAGYGSYSLGQYRVFVSDKGNRKEDFDTAPVIVSSVYGSRDLPHERINAARLSGYAGKDVYIAFVNRSKDAGLTGVTGITVAPYYMRVADTTPEVVPEGEAFSISLATTTYSPHDVRGLKAELETSVGISSTLEIDKKILSSGTGIDVTFPELIEMPSGSVEYTVTLTPLYEGASPTVVTGVVSSPSTTYPPVAVIEEFTGGWCSNCPRGAAYMNYYHDRHDGSGVGKVIGIALHYNDAMEIEGKEYLSTAQQFAGTNSFPAAFFSRTVQADPSEESVVTDLLAKKSYSRIHIDKVGFNPDSDEEISVDYAVENAYSKNDINQRVAFVVVENDVRGDNSGYNQVNGLSGVSRQAIENTYGADLWPYFQFYCESPATIRYTNMVYNHVARGIYPDYYGALLQGPYQVGSVLTGSYGFSKPDNVLVWDNISVIAMLIDNTTGRIISADEVSAEHFNEDLSGVEEVGEDMSDDVQVSVTGKVITVCAPSEMTVEIYGVDGCLQELRHSSDTTMNLAVPSFSGVHIIRVTTANGAVTRKVVI